MSGVSTVTELDPPAVRPPPPDEEHVGCRYPECGRPLKAPTSRALHLGPTCFAKLIGEAGGRRVTAVHAGQLVLDLDADHGSATGQT